MALQLPEARTEMRAHPLPASIAGDDVEDQASIAALAHILRSGSEPERCLAAQALGMRREAVDVLMEALRDPDPDVRSDVADALAGLDDGRAIPDLLDNLRDDPVGEIKVSYIRALASLGAADAAALLGALAEGRGEDQGVAWEDEYSEWDDWLDVQMAAIEALAAVGSADEVEPVVAVMTAADGQDLWAVGTRTLACLGDAGCAAIERLCETASPLARKRIAASLVAGDADIVDGLLSKLCRDDDAAVRIEALRAASARGYDDLCRAGLEDVVPDVREATIACLAGADPAVIAGLLDDISPRVRIAACRAIAERGRPRAGLGLVRRVERALRTAAPALLAAMVSAMAVAEPGTAGEVLEDIANHPATAPEVRRAALRALGDLETKNAVSLLAAAAGDARQSIRLEAVAGLGRIAGRGNGAADAAVAHLRAAIDGTLVDVPDGWHPEDDDGVSLPPRRGKQAAGDDGEARIRIDREGNIIAADKHDDAETSERQAAGAAVELPGGEPAPSSTLSAILDADSRMVSPAGSVEIDEEDISLLEMATSRPGRRKVAIESGIAAHVDIRRLAARIAGDIADGSLVLPLSRALAARDAELGTAAARALAEMAAAGIDISPAAPQLLEQARRADVDARRLAIAALGHIPGEATADTLHGALSDPAGVVRASALDAASRRTDIDIDLAEIRRDPERRVRLAAARLIAKTQDPGMVDALLDLAMADGGVHKLEIARLLAPLGARAKAGLTRLLQGVSPHERLIALAMFKVVH